VPLQQRAVLEDVEAGAGYATAEQRRDESPGLKRSDILTTGACIYDETMNEVRLTGRLVCKNADEARRVSDNLPKHIALTRAEPGCISFSVAPTADPMTWQVEERFEDEAVFTAHQNRVTGSEWGQLTAGIERRYSIEGLSL
jgi:quinol monooxygenase YgiN